MCLPNLYDLMCLPLPFLIVNLMILYAGGRIFPGGLSSMLV